MTTTYKIKPGAAVTSAQAGFLRKLAAEAGTPEVAEDALTRLDRAGVSAVIDQMVAAKKAAWRGAGAFDAPTTKEGYYQNEAGDVYVVKANKNNGHTSAKKLWFLDAADGDRLPRWTYEKGAVYRLEGMVPLTVDEMTRLSHYCGRCIICGRPLEDKTSVTRGIGPVCIKKLAS